MFLIGMTGAAFMARPERKLFLGTRPLCRVLHIQNVSKD